MGYYSQLYDLAQADWFTVVYTANELVALHLNGW